MSATPSTPNRQSQNASGNSSSRGSGSQPWPANGPGGGSRSNRDGQNGPPRARSLDGLTVYKNARQMAVTILPLTHRKPFADEATLAVMVRQTALSVVARIADGFERASKSEFIECLSSAKGACGAVRAQLAVAGDLGYLESAAREPLDAELQRLTGMLSHFIHYLREGHSVKGQGGEPRAAAAN